LTSLFVIRLLQAVGAEAAPHLPRCRGRHPHLGRFDAECPSASEVRTLVLGASNQWFAVSLSAIHLPSGREGVAAEVERLWSSLDKVSSPEVLQYALATQPELVGLRALGADAVWDAIKERRQAQQGGPAPGVADVRVAEYQALTHPSEAPDQEDFTVRQGDVPAAAEGLVEQVVLVDRLRVTRAPVGSRGSMLPNGGAKPPPIWCAGPIPSLLGCQQQPRAARASSSDCAKRSSPGGRQMWRTTGTSSRSSRRTDASASRVGGSQRDGLVRGTCSSTRWRIC
jgi:hypothetical protein